MVASQTLDELPVPEREEEEEEEELGDESFDSTGFVTAALMCDLDVPEPACKRTRVGDF